MLDLPERTPKYHRGRSTPRPFRVNDLLWHDFADLTAAQGFRPAEAIRRLMERYVLINRKTRKTRKGRVLPDEAITVAFDEE